MMEIVGIKLRKKYYFVDESGDPSFYDKDGFPLKEDAGFQPYFILGMVETTNRTRLRNRVVAFVNRIRKDVLYNAIPSIAEDAGWFVHARKDHPEVRINFIELLRKIKGFSTRVLVIEKNIHALNEKRGKGRMSLYLEALQRLFGACEFDRKFLHIFYVSQFGSNQMAILNEATAQLKAQGINFELHVVASKLSPEMSVVDYMLWMIHRKLMKGESRFFDALRHKYGVVLKMQNKKS